MPVAGLAIVGLLLTGAPTNSSVSAAVSNVTVSVYAAYYDTHHANGVQQKPSPWQGSPNVVFVGTPDSASGGWDAGAVRLDNLSGRTLTKVALSVDIGRHHFALWGTNTLPAGQSLIVTQMGSETFDGSDFGPPACNPCNTEPSTVPVVHVTINGRTTSFYDTQQILNTHGLDSAVPEDGSTTTIRDDESEAWDQLSGRPGVATRWRPFGAGMAHVSCD